MCAVTRLFVTSGCFPSLQISFFHSVFFWLFGMYLGVRVVPGCCTCRRQGGLWGCGERVGVIAVLLLYPTFFDRISLQWIPGRIRGKKKSRGR